MIEPLYPRGGLLGGSSKEAPKKSKLAALAAARKAKANDQTSNLASPAKPVTNSVNLLDKLGKSKNIDNEASSPVSAAQPSPSLQRLRKYPPRRISSTEKETSQVEEPIPTSTNPEPKEVHEDPNIKSFKPSGFAVTMLGSNQSPFQAPSFARFYDPFQLECDMREANIDPFSGPSPDDIVAKAQSASKGMRPKGQKGAESTNGVNNAASELGKVSITESKPPKSKNLNVLEEYNKSKRKNAANFVVIGKGIPNNS
jgi:elongation factor 1 alpha-like protein